jgi:6-phosphogluconolactonase
MIEASRVLQRDGARVLVYPGPRELVDAVHAELRSLAARSIAAHGSFSIALSGGSTPAELYRRLAEAGGGLPWNDVELFFGDERHVPPSHPDSNYRMAHETMLRAAAVPDTRVHRIESELPSADAARRYEDELCRILAPEGGTPRFDLVLLGLGQDAHTASLFPHTPMLHERTRFVTAGRVPKLDADRITITYPVIEAARNVWFLVAGETKAETVARVLDGEEALEDTPARGARPDDGPATWWLDESAAAALRT